MHNTAVTSCTPAVAPGKDVNTWNAIVVDLQQTLLEEYDKQIILDEGVKWYTLNLFISCLATIVSWQ